MIFRPLAGSGVDGVGVLSIVRKPAIIRVLGGPPRRAPMLPAAPRVRYNRTMPALVSLLALVLAAPGPAAPPLSPTADNDAVYKEIVAGDPALTTSPAPLERLVVATELAEEKLRQADVDDDMEDLLTLAAQGRRAAYGRTGEALHMCRLIAAADVVLARDGVRPGLQTAAKGFRQEAQGKVGAKACEDAAPHGESDGPPPDGAKTDGPPLVIVGPSKPPTPHSAPPPVDRADRRFRVGVGTLVPGLLLFAPMAGLLAYGGDGREELAGINAATRRRPGTPAEEARVTALDNRYIATTAGAVALGLTGAALVVTGAVLMATGRRPNRVAVAPWGGRGIGGLVLQGRF